MLILDFILLGLGVMKVIELQEEAFPWSRRMWFISFQSVAASFTAVFFLGPSLPAKTQILWSFGVAGSSAIWHGIENLLRALAHRANADWVSRSPKTRQKQIW